MVRPDVLEKDDAPVGGDARLEAGARRQLPIRRGGAAVQIVEEEVGCAVAVAAHQPIGAAGEEKTEAVGGKPQRHRPGGRVDRKPCLRVTRQVPQVHAPRAVHGRGVHDALPVAGQDGVPAAGHAVPPPVWASSSVPSASPPPVSPPSLPPPAATQSRSAVPVSVSAPAPPIKLAIPILRNMPLG